MPPWSEPQHVDGGTCGPADHPVGLRLVYGGNGRCGEGDERDTTTPAAIARTYAALLVGSALNPRDRRRLRRWMLGNQTSDVRFRAGLPRGWRLADKTGGGDYGTNNDVGVAVAWSPSGTPIVIAALTRRAEQDADTDDTLLADLARLVADRLDR